MIGFSATFGVVTGHYRRPPLRAATLALGLWLMTGGAAHADRWGPPWESQVVVDRAVVYSRPDPSSVPVGPLGRGAFVVVLGEEEGTDGTPWEKIPDGYVLKSQVEEFHWPWTAEVTVPSVSVYAKPYVASGVIRTARRGDLLRVTGVSSGLEGDQGTWWATTAGYVPLGTVGWATNAWAGWWQMPDPSEAPAGWWGAIVEQARVRTAPSTDAPIVGVLKSGERVKVLSEEEGSPIDGSSKWYRIDGGRYAGGRIHSSVVRPLPEPRSNTTAPPSAYDPDSWIVVDRSASSLTFVKSGKPVFTTYVSLGLAGVQTPAGTYTTFGKFRGDRMSSRQVENPSRPYDLPNVPFTQYYKDGGFAIHGTYWHDGFGLPESQGCINLTWTDSGYLFNLTQPSAPEGWNEIWMGDGATPVVIVN